MVITPGRILHMSSENVLPGELYNTTLGSDGIPPSNC
ncbi:MAG: hypothetical protein PWQ63_279 [Methanolobus sp.]|jgi:hypothetical protein|nr:hypothetical protein [Methanolobus bombayensis]MDK2825998.1 hypothetical protein [Methanolobus sp.]MDK2947119.1 hypothetical protein [Methanolobus sp.]